VENPNDTGNIPYGRKIFRPNSEANDARSANDSEANDRAKRKMTREAQNRLAANVNN